MATVIIVDDSLIIRNILKNILVKHGFNVIGQAQDGEDGYYMYKILKPDLVTMDMSMPNMNGLESLQKIIAFDKKAKVIMVTATGQEIDVVKSVRFGAKGYILKPINKEKIAETLTKLFPDLEEE